MNKSSDRESIISSKRIALARGCHEISFASPEKNPPELPLLVAYTLPSGVVKTTRGFATNDGKLKARCYVFEEGFWKWEAKNLEGKCIDTGEFQTEESPFPGKLRVSQSDPRQLRYQNGKWYLHFGDNAYRFLSRDEPNWRAYIDQAAQAGFNHIRTWLSPSSDGLFLPDRKQLDLETWDAIDERLIYALQRHPEIQFEVILFGNDPDELQRFGDGDPVSHLALRYAIERFGPLPNVHWSISSGVKDSDKDAKPSLVMIADAVFGHEQWNSLTTFAGKRFDPVAFADEKWLSAHSLRSLGQVTGEAILSARAETKKPILLAEDRGEHTHPPRFPRYYFRRLFWGALLSGGMPSYSGMITSERSDHNRRGIEGYYDACNAGHLRFGAHDLLNIKKFFAETGISLENWTPDDSLSGSQPLLAKSIRSEDANECIAYIANPESFAAHSPDGYEGMHSDQVSDTSPTFTTFTLELSFSSGTVKWFSPTTGEWNGEMEITKNSTTLLTPTPGDWVVWVKRA